MKFLWTGKQERERMKEEKAEEQQNKQQLKNNI